MAEPVDVSRKHFYVSMVKSVVRIVGYGLLPVSIGLGAAILAGAELLGIVEEL